MRIITWKGASSPRHRGESPQCGTSVFPSTPLCTLSTQILFSEMIFRFSDSGCLKRLTVFKEFFICLAYLIICKRAKMLSTLLKRNRGDKRSSHCAAWVWQGDLQKKSLHPRVCWHTPVNITLRSGCRQISVFQVCLWDRVLQHTLAGLELSKQSKLVWNLGRCFAASWVLGLQICAVLPGSHFYSPVMFPLDGRGVTSFPI